MKILFAFHNVFFFRYFDGVIRSLRLRGHEVTIAVDLKTMTEGYSDRALRACVQETGCLEEPIIQPVKWSKLGAAIRDINGYGNYFRKGHPSPTWAAKWKKYFHKRVQRALDFSSVDLLFRLSFFRWFLRKVERFWLPDLRVVEHLRKDRPNVVVACPFIWTMSYDADYIKAAAKLKIPTVAAVASWDHLAGKGLFPLIPHATIVWNHEMARDAFYLQNVPADKIVTTGSPPFDFWFDAVPHLDRKAFLKEIGFTEDTPYVLYLCSSRPIAGNSEPDVVKNLLESFSHHTATKEVRVVVRPYPSMAKVWHGLEIPKVKVWPKDGEWPDTNQARQVLFDTIYHSTAVIGINTTAMIETCVVNRPCITLMTTEFEASQTGRAHFQQMLKGGFLEIVRDFNEAAEALAGILSGNDSKSQNRIKFAKDFLRPGGLERRASESAAEAIEMVSKGMTSGQIRSLIPGQWNSKGSL